MSKVFKNGAVPGYDGKPVKIVEPGKTEPSELKLTQILWLILNNAEIRTQQDSIQGKRLAEALDAAKGTIEMEDGVHDWLKPQAEKLTPILFRISGNDVYKHICEGYEKPHQPKDTEEEPPKDVK